MAVKKKSTVRLSEFDWDVLFPSTDYPIGSTILKLKPLSIEDLVSVLNIFRRFENERFDSMTSVADIKKLAGSDEKEGAALKLIKAVPEVLSLLSGLDVEDVKGLPPIEALRLFNKCLDVNLESQEELTKNLQELAEKVADLTKGATPTA